MTSESKRRRVVDALEVRWTPALAARVQRRLEEAVVRRRRRRRAAAVGLALAMLGGVGFAFTRAPELLRRWRNPASRPTSLSRPGAGDALPVVAPAATATSHPGPPPEPQATGAVPAPNPRPPDAVDQEARRLDVAGQETRPPRTAHRRLAAGPLRPPGAAAVESVSSLFAKADAARLAGRPAAAVAPLTAIVARFPGDSRAAIAAFQLGRVLADELHDPAAAARAFERAHDLAPDGPLANDAATRASEARRAAGTRGEARP
jgi:hypothetical protein